MAMATRGAGNRKAIVSSRARVSIIWALGAFVVLQLFYHFPLTQWHPQLHDAEYGQKLAGLRTHLHKNPKPTPFIVGIGSSLISMGLRPDALTACQPENPAGPLVYNFGMNGTRSIVQLLCLQRLLADGIRPDWVLIEIYPRFYFGTDKKAHFPTVRLQQQDFPVVDRYFEEPREIRSDWRKGQCLPWFYHRNCLQNLFLPGWVPADKRLHGDWQNTDEWGWICRPDVIQSLKRNYRTPQYVKNIAETNAWYNQQDVIKEIDGALREMLSICQREKIGVVLLRMPESSYLRNGYSSAMNDRIDRWLASLGQDAGVSVVSALDWLADDEFADGIHADLQGAVKFTRRLESEVIRHLRPGQTQPTPPTLVSSLTVRNRPVPMP